MVRAAWFAVAAILALLGYDLLLRDWLGETGWFLVGVGVGIATAPRGRGYFTVQGPAAAFHQLRPR